MMKRIQKKTIWAVVISCIFHMGPISAQEDNKAAAKKPQTVELQMEVSDKEDGSPLNNVRVQVKWGGEESDLEKAAVTSRTGVAKVKDVPLGTVTIRLIANGYKTFAKQVDLKTEKQ